MQQVLPSISAVSTTSSTIHALFDLWHGSFQNMWELSKFFLDLLVLESSFFAGINTS